MLTDPVCKNFRDKQRRLTDKANIIHWACDENGTYDGLIDVYPGVLPSVHRSEVAEICIVQ